MSFKKCVQDAIDEGSIDPTRGQQAQDLWEALAGEYERSGHPRHHAEYLAGQDVTSAFTRRASEGRHVTLAQLAAALRPSKRSKNSDRLETLMTDTLEHAANSSNSEASVIAQQRVLGKQILTVDRMRMKSPTSIEFVLSH